VNTDQSNTTLLSPVDDPAIQAFTLARSLLLSNGTINTLHWIRRRRSVRLNSTWSYWEHCLPQKLCSATLNSRIWASFSCHNNVIRSNSLRIFIGQAGLAGLLFLQCFSTVHLESNQHELSSSTQSRSLVSLVQIITTPPLTFCTALGPPRAFWAYQVSSYQITSFSQNDSGKAN